ncbi:MAG: phosphoribosylglycinamide formyltransferase [Campylobacterales bacterium]
MARIVILFSGRGGNLENLIRKLGDKAGIEIAAALTNNPQADGIAKAQALGVKVLCVPHKEYPDRESFDRALIAALEPIGPDLVVLAGFMRILTPVFTRRFETINIHPSLLPLFKGKDGVKESFESGMKVGGVTIHRVDETLDGGEILAQGCVPILPTDTEESYRERVHALEYELYPKTIEEILC